MTGRTEVIRRGANPIPKTSNFPTQVSMPRFAIFSLYKGRKGEI